MKKTFLLFALITLALPAFAQDNDGGNRRMTVTVSLPNPFMVIVLGPRMGLAFEYALTPYASIRASVMVGDGGNGGYRSMFSRFNLDGRWYPTGNQGLFFSGGLQFQRSDFTRRFPLHPMWNDEEDEPGLSGWRANTLSVFAGVGNKMVWGNSQRRTAFVMEPTAELGIRVICDARHILLGPRGPRLRLPIGLAFGPTLASGDNNAD